MIGTMAITKTALIDFADLRYLVISCPNCKTEIIMDICDERATLEEMSCCPTCIDSGGYERSFRQAVESYRSAWKKFTDTKRNTVRIKLSLTD